MKSLKYAALVLLLSTPAFAAIGEDNLVITFNFGANRSTMNNYPVDASYALQGFALGFDFGYQHYTSKDKRVIQGHDLMIGLHYGMDKAFRFNGVALPSLLTASSRPLMGYISSTYSLGFYMLKTRFMFDLIGLQLMYGERHASSALAGITLVEQKEKNYIGAAFNLPLGFRAVLDMGLVVGFRHSYAAYFPINMGGIIQHHYNFNFVIGFSFGGDRKK